MGDGFRACFGGGGEGCGGGGWGWGEVEGYASRCTEYIR